MAVTRIEVFTDLISECEVGKKEYEWEFNCYYSLWMELMKLQLFWISIICFTWTLFEENKGIIDEILMSTT